MKTLDILLVVLLCIGAIQGLIYGVILWRNQGPHAIANKFLSAILFFFSYRLIAETMKMFELGRYDFWYHVLLEYNWVYGPLVFLFTLSYVTPNFKFKRKYWVHFIPVFIEIIWSFFIKSQNFYWDGTRESLTWLGYWGYVIWMQIPTMYLVSGLLIIYYGKRSLTELKKATLNPKIQCIAQHLVWIKRVIYALMGFSVLYLIGIAIDFLFFDFSGNVFYGHPVFIGMAIITYWLGIEGFNRRNQNAFKVRATLSDSELSQLQAISKQLNVAMTQDQLFKDSNLTLNSLAQAIDQKPYLVTKTLSAVQEQKFSDYVNTFRIQEVKRLIADPKNKQYTLLSLAFEAGFNSKASFNRAVKKITGKSPSSLL